MKKFFQRTEYTPTHLRSPVRVVDGAASFKTQNSLDNGKSSMFCSRVLTPAIISDLGDVTNYFIRHLPPNLHNAGEHAKWEAFSVCKLVEQKLVVANCHDCAIRHPYVPFLWGCCFRHAGLRGLDREDA